jgi:hypothetical protein
MRLGDKRCAIGLIKHSFAILNVGRETFLITHDELTFILP